MLSIMASFGGSWHPVCRGRPRSRRAAKSRLIGGLFCYDSAPMVKAILFDLDGVLVDSYEVWFYLLNEVARRNHYAPITREQYKTSWGQGLEVDLKLYYTRHTVEQLRAEYDILYGEFLHHMKV